MVSFTSLSSLFLLGVSLVGNWEQLKELDLRSIEIAELKQQRDELLSGADLNQQEIERLKTEWEHAKERQDQLAEEIGHLRDQKVSVEAEVAVLREGLKDKRISEEKRLELERALAKANGTLEMQQELIVKREAESAKTQEHLRLLSMNQCGSLTPRGMLQIVNSWADVSPWTICILGNVIFSTLAAILYRMVMYPRRKSVAIADGFVPIYDRWLLYVVRKVVTWCVAIFSLTILPVLLRDIAGRQAMGLMEDARLSFCHGASWCTWGFDRIITPNAILIAEGEAYVHAARGWQRVVISQTMALLSDQALVLAISIVAWPFTGRRQAALSDEEEQVCLEDAEEQSDAESEH